MEKFKGCFWIAAVCIILCIVSYLSYTEGSQGKNLLADLAKGQMGAIETQARAIETQADTINSCVGLNVDLAKAALAKDRAQTVLLCVSIYALFLFTVIVAVLSWIVVTDFRARQKAEENEYA